MTAAEETRKMGKQQLRGNGQAITIGDRGATTELLTMVIKQQSTNVWWQGQKTMLDGEQQGMVVKAEEKLLCGGRGETAS